MSERSFHKYQEKRQIQIQNVNLYVLYIHREPKRNVTYTAYATWNEAENKPLDSHLSFHQLSLKSKNSREALGLGGFRFGI